MPEPKTDCFGIDPGSILVRITMSSATTNMMIWMIVVAETATMPPSPSGTICWNAGNAVSTTRTTPARNR